MDKKISMLGFFLSVTMAYASSQTASDNSGTAWGWIIAILVMLAGVGVILWIYNHKIQSLQTMLDKQMQMEHNQNLILTNMSENLRDIAERTLTESHQMIQRSDRTDEEKTEMMNIVQDKLLTVTNDLIDFLQIKSKKVEIKNAHFNLNNVLNEVSGLVCSAHKDKDVELIFEVNSTVPRFVIGDSLHLEQILTGIFEHAMGRLSPQDELKLEVSVYNNYEEDLSLQFKFLDNGRGLSKTELEDLVSPYYDETTGRYIGLAIYVSHALAKLMGGQLVVQSALGKGTTYILDLPFKIPEPNNKRKYRLPSKVLTEKNVIIVDTNYNSALAIKKMFAYFRHDVKVVSKEDFEASMPKMDAFDIVVINEALFGPRLIDYLSSLKEQKELKVIALNNMMKLGEERYDHEAIDIHLFKPLTQERVFELIISLYEIKVPQYVKSDGNESIPKVKVHKSEIKEASGITQESFAKFTGKNLLIVEDNIINQKVLVSVLSKSGMKITLANDGEQAVNIVKSRKTDFDMILMDINMPVMDGYAATKLIRQNGDFDAVPIVAFTALILESEKQKMFSSGITAFLAKPLNIGKLYTVFMMYMSEAATTNGKKSEQPTEKFFDGLDVEKGIAHANNNEALYIELLKGVKDAYGDSDEVFETLAHDKRYEQLKMLCIDLRGLAGTIGAYDLQELVNEVHQHLLYKKLDLITKLATQYKAELQRVKKAIDEYIVTSEMYDED